LEISEELNQTEKNKKDSENLSYGLVSSSIPVYTWLSKMIDFPLSKGFVCVCLKKE